MTSLMRASPVAVRDPGQSTTAHWTSKYEQEDSKRDYPFSGSFSDNRGGGDVDKAVIHSGRSSIDSKLGSPGRPQVFSSSSSSMAEGGSERSSMGHHSSNTANKAASHRAFHSIPISRSHMSAASKPPSVSAQSKANGMSTHSPLPSASFLMP
jgi:hypothetical protein